MTPARVLPYAAAPHLARVEEEVEAIFFATAARSGLASERERDAFRHRWLDRYLIRHLDDCFVALDADGHAAGYLVGAAEDVSALPSFREVAYFAAFAPECAAHPAHLHLNVRPDRQRQGIGRRLIEAFAAHARAKGAGAMHVVTGAAAGNVGFYERVGFARVREREVDGKLLVMLGRRLDGRQSR